MNWLTDALGFGPKGQMRKSITAREAFESPEWLGGLIGAPSFAPMRILAIAAMGEGSDGRRATHMARTDRRPS